MKVLAQKGLEDARMEFANRTDDHALHDLEIEVEFWLRVDECEFCDDKQLCTIHYERLWMCL
jgi:hypothetical protein